MSFLEKYTDREVFLTSLSVVLICSVMADYFQSRRVGYVEARLERIEEDMSVIQKEVDPFYKELDSYEDRKQPDKLIHLPETPTPQLFNTGQRIHLSKKEFYCLSRNIYQEAKFEPYIGKMAVAHVTYNRLKQGKWGGDICNVVYAPKQFSWTIFRKQRNEVPRGPKWVASKHTAEMFVRGVRVTNLDGSDHYYSDVIKKPKWANKMVKNGKIAHHTFYTSLQ